MPNLTCEATWQASLPGLIQKEEDGDLVLQVDDQIVVQSTFRAVTTGRDHTAVLPEGPPSRQSNQVWTSVDLRSGSRGTITAAVLPITVQYSVTRLGCAPRQCFSSLFRTASTNSAYVYVVTILSHTAIRPQHVDRRLLPARSIQPGRRTGHVGHRATLLK